MPYLLLITEPRGQRQSRTAEEGVALYQQMLDFTEDLKNRGLHLASESLLSDAHGVRVSMRGGKPCEEALEWSRRFPNPAGAGKSAEIEVRQLYELDDFGESPAVDQFRELQLGKSL